MFGIKNFNQTQTARRCGTTSRFSISLPQQPVDIRGGKTPLADINESADHYAHHIFQKATSNNIYGNSAIMPGDLDGIYPPDRSLGNTI
jgi:hypothetical protein